MKKKNTLKKGIFIIIMVILALNYSIAQIPSGYYNSATGSGYTLKTQLHDIIDDHTVVSYNTVYVKYNITDIDPEDGYIYDIYSENPNGTDPYNYTYWINDCGNYDEEGDCYNREHSFPKSWFGGEVSPMYTDIHHVIPTDGQVNSWRSNHPYGETNFPSITSENGSKIGPGRTGLGYTGTVFEPIDEFKGDVARIYFYMATRYEDILTTWPGSEMLDGSKTKVFEDWALDMLLDWHQNDPVSQKEIDRNDAIYYFVQSNRNPFVDHPEYVGIIWNNEAVCDLASPFTTGDSRCGPGSVTLSATPASGGTSCKWYASPSSSTVLNTGTSYSPTISQTTQFYVSTINGDCESASRSSVLASVQSTESVSFTGLNESYCDDYNYTYMYGSPSGGDFSGPGVYTSDFGSYFSPSAVGPGTYTITYSYFNGSCSAEVTQDVTVYAVPNATISGLAPSYKESDDPVTVFGSPEGGTFNGPGMSDNIFDPETAGIGTHQISYSYTSNGCLDVAKYFVTVTGSSTASSDADMILTGIYDGPLAGNPKGVELYVIRDIPDLSEYGFGSASNGGGSDGVEYTFPSIAVSKGTFLYLAADSAGFREFMGFDADFTDISAGVNGNDAVELFLNSTLIDAFGDKDDGSFNSVWAYQDGWAYRKDCTGPDTQFPISSNWTFSGIDALDFETSNATASNPIPLGTYFCEFCDRTTSTLSVTACDSYLSPSGKLWTTSDIYYDTIPNAANCDSIITVNLVINETYSENINMTTCDLYIAPSGKAFAQSGIYMDTVSSNAGCDSIVTIDLTILKSTTSNLQIEACDSYTSPSGKIWTESNTYVDEIPNAAGCDSTISIDLTINESSYSELLFYACDSFVFFNGDVFTSSGIYFDTSINTSGCPNIFELDLRISNSSYSSVSETTCGSFTSPSGKIWTESGIHMDTIPNAASCDSIITFDLTITSLEASVTASGPVLTASPADGQYTWLNCTNGNTVIADESDETFTAESNGSYAVQISKNGCIDTSECVDVFSTSVDFESFNSEVEIYPNPTNGSLSIKILLQDRTNVNIQITDIMGRFMAEFEEPVASELFQKKLLLNDYPSGLYFIKIQQGEKQVVRKLIIRD